MKNMGGWWRWALVSPDGVAPSRVIVSATVNLPLHHKVQKFSSGTGSPGWSRKKGRKTVVCVVLSEVILCLIVHVRWYYPDITPHRSEEILREDGSEGCFLVRDSRKPGLYTLSLLTKSVLR